jgi:hypothetical protein
MNQEGNHRFLIVRPWIRVDVSTEIQTKALQNADEKLCSYIRPLIEGLTIKNY